mgnify:CR=1 FL=1
MKRKQERMCKMMWTWLTVLSMVLIGMIMAIGIATETTRVQNKMQKGCVR